MLSWERLCHDRSVFTADRSSMWIFGKIWNRHLTIALVPNLRHVGSKFKRKLWTETPLENGSDIITLSSCVKN